MTSKVELAIEAIYRGRQNVDAATSDLGKLDKAAQGAASGLEGGNKAAMSLSDRFGALKSTLKSTLLPAVGVIASVGVAAKKAFDWAAEGAMIEMTSQRFDTLARSIGSVGTALTVELRQATGGAASDMELMAGASRLMAMGLVNSGDQLSRMLGMVSRLKQPQQDLNSAIEDFSLLLANRSILRLDTFNISGARTKQILEGMGVASAQAATDAEFLEAVMRAGQESMERMGVTAGTTSTKFVTLGAAWRTLMDEMKRDSAQDAQGGTWGIITSNATLEIQKITLEKQLKDIGIGGRDIARAAQQAGISWHTMGNAAQANAVKVAFLTDLLLKQVKAQDELNRMMSASRSQADDLDGAYQALGVTFKNLDDDHERERQNVQENIQRTERATAATRDYAAMQDRLAASEAAAHDRAVTLNAAMQERRSLMEQELSRGADVTPLAQQIFNIGEASGAGAQKVGALLIATGEFSKEAVSAAIKSAILKQAIDEIIGAFFNGTISAETAAKKIDDWQASIANLSVADALVKLNAVTTALNQIPTSRTVTVSVMVDDQTGQINHTRNGQTVSSNATGTNYFPGGWTWVGERGPELMRLPRGSQIMSNPQSSTYATQHGGYTVNVSIGGDVNRDDFRRIVQKEFPRVMRDSRQLDKARRRA